MKTTIFTLFSLAFLGLSNTFAQVGIGSSDPKTTLQLVGDPASATTADGVQGPSLSLAQLDAKVAAYGADQDGAIVYIVDVTTASTKTETANITTSGYYYYDASKIVWKKMETPTYSVGNFAHGGIVFWVDETGQHGLVCAKADQSTGIKWRGGSTNYRVMALGDGPYAGKINTSIIISVHAAKNDFDSHAARICNELQTTEGGKTYGDWYLPSRAELNLMYQNKATIDATATSNGGGGFASAYYWSSNEEFDNYAWVQDIDFGTQFNTFKSNAVSVRAVRAF